MRTDVDTRITAPTSPHGRWRPLALGLAGLVAAPLVGVILRLLRSALDPVSVSSPGPSPGMLGVAAALALAVAGVVSGVRALRGDPRTRAVWLGTIVSGVVLLFWALFALGEVLFPH